VQFNATLHCATLGEDNPTKPRISQGSEYSTHWGTLGTLGLNIALFGCTYAHEEYWWKYIYDWIVNCWNEN
jgi:hypothetical protein